MTWGTACLCAYTRRAPPVAPACPLWSCARLTPPPARPACVWWCAPCSYDMGAAPSTRYEPRDSVSSGPPMNFVVSSTAPGAGHVQDSKEHPTGKSRRSIRNTNDGPESPVGPGVSSMPASSTKPAEADASAMEMPRIGGYTNMFRGRSRASAGGSVHGDAGGVDAVPSQVRHVTALTMRLGVAPRAVVLRPHTPTQPGRSHLTPLPARATPLPSPPRFASLLS